MYTENVSERRVVCEMEHNSAGRFKGHHRSQNSEGVQVHAFDFDKKASWCRI